MASISISTAPSTDYTLADQRRMAQAKNYFAWQGQLVRREIGKRVLEIGCGVGNFTSLLLDRDLVIAIDKESACVEALRQRYPERANLRVFTCDAARGALLPFAEFAPDSCVCLNVLEHMEDDCALLQDAKAVLSPGGVIILLVPAFPSLYGPIDRNLGHFRRYTMRLLREVAAAAGLRIKKARYMNAIGFFGWWANARLFRRAAQSESQIQFFDRYVVPVAARVESVAPPPFGQSIFAVLQKP